MATTNIRPRDVFTRTPRLVWRNGLPGEQSTRTRSHSMLRTHATRVLRRVRVGEDLRYRSAARQDPRAGRQNCRSALMIGFVRRNCGGIRVDDDVDRCRVSAVLSRNVV
jgi:hypothetical protein